MTLRDALWSQLRDEMSISPVRADRLSLAEFIEGSLASPLWSRQREVVEAVERYQRVAVRSCHGAGKSYVAARIAVAFLQLHPHSIVITTAVNAAQVEGVLWRYIRTTAANAAVPLRGKRGHPLTKKWEIDSDWYAVGLTASEHNTDALQGRHSEHILVIVDEAAGVSEEIHRAVGALLTGAGARLLLIGNPTSMSGTFREAFHGNRDHGHTISISAEDTPNFTEFNITRADMEAGTWQDKLTERVPYPDLIDPAYVALQIAEYGAESPYISSRIWAEFPTGSDYALIPLAQIEAAEWRNDLHSSGPLCAGIDVARFGSDETAIHLRQGERSIADDAWHGADITESVGRVVRFLDAHRVGKREVELRVDTVGVGAGLHDRLREAGYRTVDVNVGRASTDPESWQNLRHEMWWQLSERFREGRIGTAGQWSDTLKAQLSDVRYSYSPRYTKPLIESKEAARKRGVRSPDRAEAMLLAFANLKRQQIDIGDAGFYVAVVRSRW